MIYRVFAMRLYIAFLVLPFVVSQKQHVFRCPSPQSGDFLQSDHERLDFTSAAPHIFASVRDLLRQWPNTFAPNGHSITPCTIPRFTTLYHARMDGFAPSSPEWLALDPELAYGIMGSGRDSHLLTYQTTHDARVLYFDGMSGVLAGEGRVDSQMAFLFGNLTGPHDPSGLLGDDMVRAHGLCEWIRSRSLGGPGGIEGFVRMAAGFEVIWCNMTSPSLRLLSYLNVTVPLNREPLDQASDNIHRRQNETVFPLPTLTQSQAPVYDPADPTTVPDPRDIAREPFQWSEVWQWYTSASWHFGRSGAGPGRGEDRVRPDTCRFLTFYSPALPDLPSSRAAREGVALNLTSEGYWGGPRSSRALQELSRRRRRHTLADISSADALTMTKAAGTALVQEDCTGVDWTLLANTIAQRYTDSLAALHHILSDWHANTSSSWLDVARDHVHGLLLPYFAYPAASEELQLSSLQSKAALSLCRFSWTRLLSPDQGMKLNGNEELLRWAVEETTGAIYTTVLKVGLGIEREWRTSEKRDDLPGAIQAWIWDVEELIAWLGWTGDHITCKERCEWNEICKHTPEA